MNFASMALADEMNHLHPEAVAPALAFEVWSKREGLPPVFVTDISRKLEWYAENHLPPQPNSWHLCDCAIDFRVTHYTPGERQLAVEWFEKRCADRTRWELISKDHGSGPHVHCARRDHEWRRKFKEKNP